MRIEHDVSLRQKNTFGIEAKAESLVLFEQNTDAEIESLFQQVQHIPTLILGGGSNVVFTSATIPLVLQHSGQKIEVAKRDDNTVLVTADAGWDMDCLVQHCISNGWYGLENLSAIPGTVGASVVQNVGAYGVEAKDVVHSVDVVDLQCREVLHMTNAECQFGYRDSLFKHFPNRFFVLRVAFLLSTHFHPCLDYKALQTRFERRENSSISATEMRSEICNLRWSKLPRPEENGSAGSFFKNPVISKADFVALGSRFANIPGHEVDTMVKVPAAWLIEYCGWKGRSMGRAAVWPKQPLVIYNTGNCSGKEVRALAESIQQDVFNTFGIALQTEAMFV
ncbi:MAG: UDP-N-acetylmuramate dehydrogenase [Bacteroidales bacterium]|nr:UDP-N-acetylmuramate dehydrogenase [Bacteroidales bacterium]